MQPVLLHIRAHGRSAARNWSWRPSPTTPHPRGPESWAIPGFQDQNPGLYQAHPFADWRQRCASVCGLAPALEGDRADQRWPTQRINQPERGPSVRTPTSSTHPENDRVRGRHGSPPSAEGRAPSVAVTPLPLALVSPAPRRLRPCRLPARTALPRADLCTPPRRCTRCAEHPRSIGGLGVGYLECMRAWVS
jgi:hypothetical protein